MVPLPGVSTLFLDVLTADDVTNSKEARSPQDFRGFQLHKFSYAPDVGQGIPVNQVAYPRLQGWTSSHWLLALRSAMTPEMEELPELSVALARADENHWNVVNDPVFPDCLAKFRARREGQQAPKTTR